MRKKWILVIVLIVLCITFSLLYEKDNVFKRAIVIGMGIDYIEGKYEISIEYLKKQDYILHTTKADSLKSALNKISKEIGLKASISQCVTIIIAKKQSVSTILLQIAKSQKLSLNAIIVANKEPKVFLESKIEASDSVSNLIYDSMQKNDQKTDIKDVLISYKTKRPIEIIGLNIQNKSLSEEEPYKLDFNNIAIN